MFQSKKFALTLLSMIMFLSNCDVFADPYVVYPVSEIMYVELDPQTYYNNLYDLQSAYVTIQNLIIEINDLSAKLNRAIRDYNCVVTDHNLLYADWRRALSKINSLEEEINNARNNLNSLTSEKKLLEEKVDLILSQSKYREDLSAQRIADRDAVLKNIYGDELANKFKDLEARAEKAEMNAQKEIAWAQNRVASIEQAMANLRKVHDAKLTNVVVTGGILIAVAIAVTGFISFIVTR
jgi:hypothetical protein